MTASDSNQQMQLNCSICCSLERATLNTSALKSKQQQKKNRNENGPTSFCSPMTLSLLVASHMDSHLPAKQGFCEKTFHFEDFKQIMKLNVK